MRSIALISILGVVGTALAAWPESLGKTINYTSVAGYFLQDEPTTDPSGFDYASVNFGLLNRTYPTDAKFDPKGRKSQWQRFAHWVKYLNNGCRRGTNVRYKVLFMGRHGEGWHNAAESYYGTPAWNCYWSELEGNGTAVWADPLLTPAGLEQADKANNYWRSRFEEQNMPAPQSYYTSPLSRCTITANLTFNGLDLPKSRPFVPKVKEFFREGISMHTCDRRSSKSYIASMFPWYEFEAGFTEEDELWRGTEAETSEAQLARTKVVLDDVFRSDDKTWISITSHSGEISKLLTALNHQSFRLSTGQIIPVLVKAELVESVPTSTFEAWVAEETCNSPPVTSISGEGCVCATTTPVAEAAMM